MNIDKLRDRAALIAFQFLLEKNKNEKFADTRLLSAEAWDMAADFMENRPGMCHNCPYANMDELAATVKAMGGTRGAGPAARQDKPPVITNTGVGPKQKRKK